MKNKLKERLKELREEKGLTQTQLAKETNISQAGIAKWETGDRTPSMDQLIILANFFDCSIDYLVGRIDYQKIMKIFAERLKLLQKDANLSAKQLGDILGVSDSTIIRWENDEISPSIEYLPKLVKYFDYPAGYFVGTED